MLVFVSIPSISFSATILLKNGQKIDGDFVGASADEIQFEVASQILKIKVQAISYIAFDKSIPTKLNASNGDHFKSDREKVLRSLKALKSVVEVGVNYDDFSQRVLDTQVKIDEYLSKYKKAGYPSFNTAVSNSMGFYAAARSAWELRLMETDLAGEWLRKGEMLCQNRYIQACSALKNRLDTENSEPSVILAAYGIYDLWECAGDSLLKAEKEL